jgi:SAM-dependent methyltransferase
MQITWLAYNVGRRGDELVSTAASVRYRLIIPARALSALGHEVRIMQVRADTGAQDLADSISGEVLVIPKYMNPDAGAFERMAGVTLGVMRAAKEKGQRVVAEISDDHFDHPTYGSYFRDLVRNCDLVVASTPGLAGIIRAHTQRPIHAVGDPYEGAGHEPRFRPPEPKASRSRSLLSILRTAPAGGQARPLRLLWFGHGSNFSALLAMLPQLQHLISRYSVEVHAVTAADTNAAQVSENFNRDYAPACTLRFTPWSVEATWRALEECDLVVIPSKLEDRTKAVKSPNRMIESLRAGRFVCANPVPSYQEFSRYAWIGEDLAAGIEWALSHVDEVLERLRTGQEHVRRHYSPEVIARQWESALADRPAAALPQGDAPVRLNLGCGDKIMAGYVNVDVAESRNDKQPDVLCDLHRLHVFGDDTADEILSVHVIEHFWRWEALDVLKEWVRVLRPGGKMILECPNLIEACRGFLEDPDRASGPGLEGQRTMWVFYGDPKWRDPLMVHRWGYTPRSLGQLMTEAGLVNVRQEPAQFKLREPRDMRVVGEKPA